MKYKILCMVLISTMLFLLSACGKSSCSIEGCESEVYEDKLCSDHFAIKEERDKLISTKWIGLYSGEILTFNEDGTAKFNSYDAKWSETDQGDILLEYTITYFLGYSETKEEIVKKEKIEDEVVLGINGKKYYPEENVGSARIADVLKIGDVVSTDIMDIKLENAELGMYAESASTSSYYGTTENLDEAYSPTNNTRAFYSAAKGRSLACFQFYIKNNDRDTINTNDDPFSFSILYGDEIYPIKGFDLNDKDGSSGIRYDASSVSRNGQKHMTHSSINILLDAGNRYDIKTLGIVGFEPNNYNDPFYFIVTMKNSNDEEESYIYLID